MSEVANSTPVVEAPQVDPWREPLDQLKQRAGIDQPAAQAQPEPQAQPLTSPPQIGWEVNTDGQAEMRLPTGEILRGRDVTDRVLRMAPEERPVTYKITQGAGGTEVHLLTGERFIGKDLNEALAKVAHSAFETKLHLKRLSTHSGQQAPNNQPTQAQPQPFIDPAMQQSPEDEQRAQQEAAEFLRAALFTPAVKQQLVTEALSSDPRVHQIASTVQEFQANNTAFEFHLRCPDYVDLPEQTQAIQQALGNLDRPATVDDLEMAWARVVYKNPQLRHVPPQSTPAPRPPIMPSAGTSQPSGAEDPWAMPLDELKRRARIG